MTSKIAQGSDGNIYAIEGIDRDMVKSAKLRTIIDSTLGELGKLLKDNSLFMIRTKKVPVFEVIEGKLFVTLDVEYAEVGKKIE